MAAMVDCVAKNDARLRRNGRLLETEMSLATIEIVLLGLAMSIGHRCGLILAGVRPEQPYRLS